MKRQSNVRYKQDEIAVIQELKRDPLTHITIDGKRHKVIYQEIGSYSRADGKGEIKGITFIGIEP